LGQAGDWWARERSSVARDAWNRGTTSKQGKTSPKLADADFEGLGFGVA
jgi:hypothetical protein